MEYSLDGHNASLSAIRTVRVLRPLRAINRVPSKYISVHLRMIFFLANTPRFYHLLVSEEYTSSTCGLLHNSNSLARHSGPQSVSPKAGSSQVAINRQLKRMSGCKVIEKPSRFSHSQPVTVGIPFRTPILNMFIARAVIYESIMGALNLLLSVITLCLLSGCSRPGERGRA